MTQPEAPGPRANAWAREIYSRTNHGEFRSELTLDELAALIQLVITEERTNVLLKIEQALMKEM